MLFLLFMPHEKNLEKLYVISFILNIDNNYFYECIRQLNQVQLLNKLTDSECCNLKPYYIITIDIHFNA